MIQFAPSQNFVVTGTMYGQHYSRGSVLPMHSFSDSAGVYRLIEQNMISPTSDPVNVEIIPPPRRADESGVSLFDAHTDLTARHESLKSEAGFDRARADEAERKLAAIEREWASQIAESDRLKTVIDEQAQMLAEANAEGQKKPKSGK